MLYSWSFVRSRCTLSTSLVGVYTMGRGVFDGCIMVTTCGMALSTMAFTMAALHQLSSVVYSEYIIHYTQQYV